MTEEEKFVPGSDADCEDIFLYPFTVEEESISFLRTHGRIMFIIRGVAGTGKNSLAGMLSNRYLGAVTCSADSHFENTFSRNKNRGQNLILSHEHCKKSVESCCKKGVHPIIVKNTHVKRAEMKNYLNIAAEYGYCVVIASTMNKFKISPEILAKSNTKGLNEEYFKNRLRQWEDLTPIVMGWFLSSGDCNHLIQQLQVSLEQLLGDGKFCRILNAFEKEKLFEHYKVKEILYCVAACSKNNDHSALMNYYSSDKVRKNYGRCFTLEIEGFLISPLSISAIVRLDETMNDLCQNIIENKDNDVTDDLNFDSLTITPKYENANFKKYNKTGNFNRELSIMLSQSAVLGNQEEEVQMDVGKCSFIHLGVSGGRSTTSPWNIKMLFHKALLGITEFGELEEGYRYCRLPNDTWIVRQPFSLKYKSVFTGMYI